MIELSIPGYRELVLENLALDFNGTLAFDGRLSNTAREIINELAGQLKVYILTADSFGTVTQECNGINAEVVIIDRENGGPDKAAFVEKIGASRTVAVGNGVNDVAMLSRAALGIAVLGPEGCAGPKRIIATLRK